MADISNLLLQQIKHTATVQDGGEGSGNFGHAGRRGVVGGSSEYHGIPLSLTEDDKRKIASVLDTITKVFDKNNVFFKNEKGKYDETIFENNIDKVREAIDDDNVSIGSNGEKTALNVRIVLKDKNATIKYDKQIRSKHWKNNKDKMDDIVNITTKTVGDSKDIAQQLLNMIESEVADGGPGSGRKPGIRNSWGKQREARSTAAKYSQSYANKRPRGNTVPRTGTNKVAVKEWNDMYTKGANNQIKPKVQGPKLRHFPDEFANSNKKYLQRKKTPINSVDSKKKVKGCVDDGNIALQALSKLGKFITTSNDRCGDAQIGGVGNVANLIFDVFDVDTIGDGGSGSGNYGHGGRPGKRGGSSANANGQVARSSVQHTIKSCSADELSQVGSILDSVMETLDNYEGYDGTTLSQKITALSDGGYEDDVHGNWHSLNDSTAEDYDEAVNNFGDNLIAAINEKSPELSNKVKSAKANVDKMSVELVLNINGKDVPMSFHANYETADEMPGTLEKDTTGNYNNSSIEEVKKAILTATERYNKNK